LKERLDGLNEVKKEIGSILSHRISYVKEIDRGFRCETVVLELESISEILFRHDVQIRQEIDEEIQKIYNEIESL
jgi:hypothetical protein